MPPISSRETIPNFALNGQELAIYAVTVFERECELRDLLGVVRDPAVEALKRALENDWVFKSQFVYPKVEFVIALQTHVIRNHETRAAFTLDLHFKFPTNVAFPEAKPFVRRPLNCPAPPLEFYPPDAAHVFDCFTLAVKVENPNLVRVHCNLPITISEKVQPKHGEMFGSFKNHELRYNPEDYEALPDPVVTDKSEHFLKLWGLDGANVELVHRPIDEQELIAHVSGGTPSPVQLPQEAQKRAESDRNTPEGTLPLPDQSDALNRAVEPPRQEESDPESVKSSSQAPVGTPQNAQKRAEEDQGMSSGVEHPPAPSDSLNRAVAQPATHGKDRKRR